MSVATDLRLTFFQECEELLEALDDGLNQLSAAGQTGFADAETVNAVFRAVHSIKGGAAAFGLEAVVRFAHQFENALDSMRSGRVQPQTEVLGLFLRSADHLADLVTAARDDVAPKGKGGADLAERLSRLAAGASAPGEVALDTRPQELPSFTPAVLDFEPLGLDGWLPPQGETRFAIRFAPSRQLYSAGHDPANLFRELARLGTLETTVDCSSLPALVDMEWNEAYLKWDLTLCTAEPIQAIHEIFEFTEGLCALEIVELPPPDPGDPKPELPQSDRTTSPDQPADADTSPAARDPATKDGRAGPTPAIGHKGTVRVDLELVDRLINIVGELVINQAMLAQCAKAAGLAGRSDIGNGLDEYRNLASELQDNIMAIRAQPVKPLFQRMARIVREASDLAGKRVRLQTEGETVEVDKTVIERLADPLTHILRNAVDHGLEPPQDRRSSGKSEVGTIRLSAAHRSGRVLIEVSDDGAGINRPKVHQIAVARGLVAKDAVLQESEIDELIFLPGFSTAATVSDLSGRGVGMDVVRSTIQALGGRVSISSQAGTGTRISISLPLTLAVLDGMVVDIAGQTMVVPITAIVETLRPAPSDIHHVAAAGTVVSIRDQFIPVIDLAETYGYSARCEDFSNKVFLLVECAQTTRWALVVDRIHDQRQVVIKGLEANYGHVPGVAAATILGDGKIALIIDPDETARVRQRSAALVSAPVEEEV